MVRFLPFTVLFCQLCVCLFILWCNKPIITQVGVQYGNALHSCVVFSLTFGWEKTYTSTQYIAILHPAHAYLQLCTSAPSPFACFFSHWQVYTNLLLELQIYNSPRLKAGRWDSVLVSSNQTWVHAFQRCPPYPVSQLGTPLYPRIPPLLSAVSVPGGGRSSGCVSCHSHRGCWPEHHRPHSCRTPWRTWGPQMCSVQPSIPDLQSKQAQQRDTDIKKNFEF